ncbi:MAG: hypothetical protein Q7R83_00710 [bacterium]|nr:hypothetical protein [bacterium]
MSEKFRSPNEIQRENTDKNAERRVAELNKQRSLKDKVLGRNKARAIDVLHGEALKEEEWREDRKRFIKEEADYRAKAEKESRERIAALRTFQPINAPQEASPKTSVLEAMDAPKEYDDQLARFTAMKETDPKIYRTVLQDLVDMAQGGVAKGVRETYQGWQNHHFRWLLEDLGEDDLLPRDPI